MHTGLHTTALMTKLSLHAIRSATTSYRSDETLITTFKNILAIHLLVCKLLPPNCFPFCFHLFLRTFQQPNPFCCNRSTTNLFMISFFSRTIDFFFFFLSLWIYLWLALPSISGRVHEGTRRRFPGGTTRRCSYIAPRK